MTNAPSLLNDPAKAWAAYEPGPDGPWDLPRVAHLHRRAGFSAPWDVLQRDLRDGPSASVARLLDGEPTSGDGQPAAEFDELLDAMAHRLGAGGSLTRLQGIWLYRMILTPHPLRERMTLFWHNHFATSEAKVKNTALMQRQNDLLRRYALGDFKALLAAMARDPAMLIWLDATANRKGHPNENYAREVMELFSLGRGHYTERDIQEAARAFTGWHVIRDQFGEIPSQHDDGVKTILGETGRFRGDDVTPILLKQPACAEFICRKLIHHFVTQTDPVPTELVAPLAQAFRDASYDLRVPVETILRSRLFHAPEIRRHRVKSPVELTVGTIRALEITRPTVSANALAEACARMGQGLFAPPSVAGWDGGPAWINTASTLARTNFALGLLSADDSGLGGRFQAEALAQRHGFTSDDAPITFFIDLLVQDALGTKARGAVAVAKSPSEAATLVLTSPEYQLA